MAASQINCIFPLIIGVSSVERCSQCSENSKVVWHAANYNGGLYEGFANIPVTDWINFTKRAIGSDDDANIKTRVEINRILSRLGIVRIIMRAKPVSRSMSRVPNMLETLV